MNKEDAKKNAEVMLAYARGEEIQHKIINHTDCDWLLVTRHIPIDFSSFEFRIKPQPKQYRPWRLEEVPVNLAIKHKNGDGAYIPTCIDSRGLAIHYKPTSNSGDNYAFESFLINYQQLKNFYSYTTDNGKTWNPCGIEITNNQENT